ncbi:MAG: DUF6632 domain-containing protein [Dermatophilaceae bacterium]
MNPTPRLRALPVALGAVGAVFTFGVYPLTKLWPSGWSWHVDGHSMYLDMILGLYATLGVFLMYAARDPLRHTSLIWFTVWSSVVHASIMTVQSLGDHHLMGHLYGDVLALYAVAAVLVILTPRGVQTSGPARSTREYTHVR